MLNQKRWSNKQSELNGVMFALQRMVKRSDEIERVESLDVHALALETLRAGFEKLNSKELHALCNLVNSNNRYTLHLTK